jgi:hypothetical protein
MVLHPLIKLNLLTLLFPPSGSNKLTPIPLSNPSTLYTHFFNKLE